MKYTWRSPLARMVRKPRNVSNNRRITKVVLHITGTSTYINAYKRKLHPLEHLWRNHFGKRGHVFSTYAICPWGQIWQLASERERPWSQGWSGRYESYTVLSSRLQLGLMHPSAKGALVVPEWWHEHNDKRILHDVLRTPKLKGITPLDLLAPGEHSPNDNSISIEFIQWQSQRTLQGKAPRNYRLTVAQYLAGNLLLHDIQQRHSLDSLDSTSSTHYLGHEDFDPWGRGKPKSGGWDPGAARPKPRFSWLAIRTGDVLDHTEPDGLLPEVIPTPDVPRWATMTKIDRWLS